MLWVGSRVQSSGAALSGVRHAPPPSHPRVSSSTSDVVMVVTSRMISLPGRVGGAALTALSLLLGARSLTAHHRRDPADGVRRCPSRIRPVALQYAPPHGGADEAFAESLTADEVYVSTTPSMDHVPLALQTELAEALGGLMDRCTRACQADATTDEARIAWRLLHVAMVALLRPLGAQRNGEQVLRERLRRLREGGALEGLWRAPICPRRVRRSILPELTAEEATRQLLDRRAVRLVHAGEPGRARAALERAGELGTISPDDVILTGEHDEVVQARLGSCVEEMLHKHPDTAEADRAIPSAAELLGAADLGTPGASLPPGGLRELVSTLFADSVAFGRYIYRLPRLSMPAVDTVRYEHAVAIARGGRLATLRDFVELVAAGTVPPEARPYVYGGRLVAPPKGDGSHRPLGAGTVWRRIAAGFMASHESESFGERLGPAQLGVGVPRGPEIFATTVRLALEAHPDWVAVKADFRNAFNEVGRVVFLAFIAAHFPVLLLFLLAAYGAPAYITALGPGGWVRYLSRRGATQGCPLGPLCFASALQTVLERVRSEYPDCLILALHDDAQVAGPPESARKALSRLIRLASEECGLCPTGHKFVIYSPTPTHARPVAAAAAIVHLEAEVDEWTSPAALARGDACRLQTRGLVAAGVPIGTASFVRDTARARLAEHEACHVAVRLLSCTQSAYVLLRYCLGARFMFLLRVCGPALRARDGDQPAPVAVHDAMQRRTLAALLERPLDLEARARADAAADRFPLRVFRQAVLPDSLGGVGLACADAVCESAFLAGICACVSYVAVHAAALCMPSDLLSADCALPTYDALRMAAAALSAHSSDPVSLSSLLSASPSPAQRALAEGVWQQRREEVLGEQTDRAHRARVLSAGGPGAGAWLRGIPVTDRMRAAPAVFRLALVLRLGVPIPELGGCVTSCGGCGAAHDCFGRHPSVCGSGNRLGLWTDRHDAVQRAIMWVFRRAGQSIRAVGQQHLFGSAGWTPSGGYLLADLFVPSYRAVGRHLFIDVAVADPGGLTPLTSSPSSAMEVGRAAHLRLADKHRKYDGPTRSVGGEFRAAVIERFGACSDDMLALLRMISGDGDRDLQGADDYTFSAPSRKSYYEQHVVFATVMADAAMLEMAISMDVCSVHDDGHGGTGVWGTAAGFQG